VLVLVLIVDDTPSCDKVTDSFLLDSSAYLHNNVFYTLLRVGVRKGSS